MGFWKVCIHPRVGAKFYVVIRAGNDFEAAALARARYPNCRWSDTVSSAQGPERRLRPWRATKHMKDTFTQKEVRKLIHAAFKAGLINEHRANCGNTLSGQNTRVNALKRLFPMIFTEGQPGHITRVQERAARKQTRLATSNTETATVNITTAGSALVGSQESKT